MDNALIVTRHAAAIEWLADKGVTGDVLEHATADDVRGRDVYGMLPLHLAAAAASITTIDLPRIPAGKRGFELTKDEMNAAGATMNRYIVTAV